ncbi:MAG: rod shape-determining protein MreD [Endomicrobium sp.]|jgi:rod shape-determining protein MreD|nr:rod shape-determining protein MreD [Endomicrobium sp.]
MKKLVYYAVLFVFSFVIQFLCSKYINVLGIFPNFILLVVVYFGLSKKTVTAHLMGFLFGLMWDVFSTDIFGVRAVMFTIVSYLSGRIFKSFDINEIFSQFFIVFLAEVIYWLGFTLIPFIILGNSVPAADYIEIILTIIIAPAIFRFLNKVILV